MSKYAGRELVLLIGSPSAVEVGQVTAVDPAGSSRNLIDASAYGDDWMDYVVGQQDGDEMNLVIAYDPVDTEHQAVIDAYDAGTEEHFELQLAAASFHIGFPALVTKCSRGAARDGLLTLNATLKILNPGVEDVTS